ncbi:MAG: hypothetical protein ABSF99_07385 [Anaerolineales bacterium]|jgi:uncharacterized protein YjcR
MPAPKGNTNALKHGLYAKHYTPEQRKELKYMSYEDLRHEINVTRVAASRIFELQVQILNRNPVDTDELAKNVNALCNAVDKISSCAVRYSILVGDNATINDSFAEALSQLPAYDPDDDTDPR